MTESVKEKKATTLVSPDAEGPLPSGWSAHQSRSNPGLLYYFNRRTGATTWNRSEVTADPVEVLNNDAAEVSGSIPVKKEAEVVSRENMEESVNNNTWYAGMSFCEEVPVERSNFLAPGWGMSTRYIAKSLSSDIKHEPKKSDVECRDMVLLGMKLDTTETQVREYFKDVEVLGVQIMQSRDNLTKYAIIKFSDWEVAKVLGRHKHSINGTLCSLHQAMESHKADLAMKSLKADPAIESLKADLAKFKEELRKTKIEREVAKYSNKATQRNIRHGMEALNKLEDVESTWAPLLEAAADGVVITADNIPQANQAVEDMTNTIKVLREHLQWEVDMQIVAAESPLHWATVHQMELSKKGEKAVCSLKEEEIHKHEKVAHKKKKNQKRKERRDKGIAMPPAKKTKADKTIKPTCFGCGLPGHMVKDCDKDFAK